MSKYETVKKLKEKGVFKEAVKSGLISSSVVGSIKVVDNVNKELKKGVGRMQAYTNVSESQKNISEHTVRLIFREYNK